ncbi:MAG TPA: class D sortase [Bryobacteraceae bacterium]|nr:class D sortase [Bryobacteraceae bacterium]
MRESWTRSDGATARRNRGYGFERPARRGRAALLGLEWFFLLLGLLALDCYVWINTSTVLYQAYQDWAFDEALRGLQPSVPGFVADEIDWLFRGKTAIPGAPETAEKFEPQPPLSTPRSARPILPDMLIGRLRIPRLGLAAMVREGADERTLRKAVGHIPGTALPGNLGNVALAGHRDTFFRALRNIRKNDAIDLQTDRGTYRYLVQSTRIVGPRDVGVLEASSGETLTLVTCYPFYYIGSAPKRFIVHATQAGLNPRPHEERGS